MEDLTGTQATALLEAFVGSGASHKKGLVPTPGATPGTTKFLREDATWAQVTESIIVAASDETTALTTGSAKVTFRMPYAFTLTAVRASPDHRSDFRNDLHGGHQRSGHHSSFDQADHRQH